MRSHAQVPLDINSNEMQYSSYNFGGYSSVANKEDEDLIQGQPELGTGINDLPQQIGFFGAASTWNLVGLFLRCSLNLVGMFLRCCFNLLGMFRSTH